MKFNGKLLSLPVGVAVFAFLALAGLVGLLALNPAQPTEAQTNSCSPVGSGLDKKWVCNFTYEEHGTGPVGTVSARDPDIASRVVKVWELVTEEVDGTEVADTAAFPALTDFTDYRFFKINRDSGVLAFKSPPDFEDPMSEAAATGTTPGEKNVYKVRAKVGDGHKFLPVEVTVRVMGKEEDGTVTLSNLQPQVGVDLAAMLEDPDGGDRTPDWQWQIETEPGSGNFVDIYDDPADATETYEPEEEDEGKKLRAIAQYDDAHGSDYARVVQESEFPVRAEPSSNEDPMFREDEDGTAGDPRTASRRIEENTPPGMKVGPRLFATDDDHLPADHASDPGGPRDVLTYSLHDIEEDITGPPEFTATEEAGNAAKFDIDQATGQIMTKAPLDFETKTMYPVIVMATDPSGDSGEITVTIHVLEEDEAPEITGPAALTYFENTVVTGATDAQLNLDRHWPREYPENNDDPGTLHRATYKVTDNDLDNDGTIVVVDGDFPQIQWELRGPDASKFQFGDSVDTYTDTEADHLDSATATPPTAASAESPNLRFRSAPDAEDPQDADKNNVYEVTVVAWDAKWEIGSREVTIRVADANDAGSITLSHVQAQGGTPITATLKDQDGTGSVTWAWTLGGTEVTSGVRSSGNTSTYTPADDVTTGALGITATYTDGKGNDEEVAYPPTGVTAVEVRGAPDLTATTADDDADDGENIAPRFYKDGVTAATATERTEENEVGSYTRYVLEGISGRNLALTELAARSNDADPDTDGAQPLVDSFVNVFDGHFLTAAAKAAGEDQITAEDSSDLQLDLSGTGAGYFEILRDDDDGTTGITEVFGQIRTKKALDFETTPNNKFDLKVTATDPFGEDTTVTVTIHVLDVPEIEGLEERIRVDENTKPITDLSAAYPPDPSLGGLKWSLLTADEPDAGTTHNRDNVASADCGFVDDSDNRCNNFRFSRFNTSDTTLRFALGDDNEAPNFEKPADVARATDGTVVTDTTTAGHGDNVYQIVVRVAFASLRSADDDNHPNPMDDEKVDQLVMIRVDNVDESPKFSDETSDQRVDEDSHDRLPSIRINRDVTGEVAAEDPEDRPSGTSPPRDPTETPPTEDEKKLTYTLDVPTAYEKLFQIVPATGEILTRSYLDYESLAALDEEGPALSHYRTIPDVTVKATDSYGNETEEPIAVELDVHDINETPLPEPDLLIRGVTQVLDYAEGQADTTVASFVAQGQDAATATWTLSGADADDFMVDPATGASTALKFASAPDFESPADADMDNTYMVTLTATVGSVMDTHDVTVMVTNADDMGTVSVTPTTAVVGMELTAGQPVDPDGGVMNVMWDWWVADTMDGDFSLEQVGGTGPSASPTYTPTAADEGRYLKARALYDDAHGTGKHAASMALEVMSADPNQALIDRYDTDPANGMIDRSEVIAAIRSYLGGDPDVTRNDVIALIRLYLAS